MYSNVNIGELNKAMTAGGLSGLQTLNHQLGIEGLKLEDLNHSVKNVAEKMSEINLYRQIPKRIATNNISEFVQLVSLGDEPVGHAREGERGRVSDSKTIRRAINIKYLQVAGAVTLQAMKVNALVDPMLLESRNKMTLLLKAVNRGLVNGSEDLIPEQADSLFTQHAAIGTGQGSLYGSLGEYYDSSKVVIDLRGAPVTQEAILSASDTIIGNHGISNTFFAPHTVLTDLKKSYIQYQRVTLGINVDSSLMSPVVTSIPTGMGNVVLNQDLSLLRDVEKGFTVPAGDRKSALTATSLEAPNAPVAVSATVAVDTASKFKAGGLHTDVLGDVYYAVSATNRWGESALTILPDKTTAVSLAAGSSVDLKWTDGGGLSPATCYTVYRTKVTSVSDAQTSGEMFYPLFKVSVNNLSNGYDGAAPGFVRDRNRILPDTEQGFQTNMSEEVLCLSELAPAFKLNLAVTAAAQEFMLLHWGSAILFKPKQFVIFINIGRFVS